jgi:hypothetical protein
MKWCDFRETVHNLNSPSVIGKTYREALIAKKPTNFIV